MVDDQAEKGKRAGAILTLLVAGGLVVVQVALTSSALSFRNVSMAYVFGASIAFIPLFIAFLIGVPAIRKLKKLQ